MSLTFPSTTDTIDEMRNAIGRNITINVPVLSGCLACSLDPVTNTSVNSFCTVCNGDYWIKIIEPHVVLAHVNWGKTDKLGWVSGGQYFDGDCLVQLKYTEENNNLVASGISYIVDGITLRKDTQIYRGVPEINRILVNLMEIEK